MITISAHAYPHDAIILVCAASQREFRTWCEQNNIPWQQPNIVRVTSVRQVTGIRPDAIVRLEGWWELDRRKRSDIDSALQAACAKLGTRVMQFAEIAR